MASTSIGRWFSRRRWDIERFGLTPAGAIARMRPPDGVPTVLSVSMPKAGTHLLERVLCLHPHLHRRLTRTIFANEPDRLGELLARARPGEVLCAHSRYTDEVVGHLDAHHPKAIFVVRDPRDVVVSKAHYSYSSSKHRSHAVASRLPRLRDRLRLFLEGDEAEGIPPFGDVLRRYSGWLTDDRCRLVRYEDLIDPARRSEAISSLLADLGLAAEPATRIGNELVSPVSVTFRRGAIGEWREVFDDELRRSFDRVAGPYLSLYGYA